MTYPTSRRGGLGRALSNHYRPAQRTRLDGHADIEALRGTPAQIVALRNRFREDRAAAVRAVMADATQSRERIAERTTQAYAEAGARYRAELDQLEAAARRADAAVHDDERDARPTPDPTLEGIQLRVGKRGDAERLHTAGIGLPTQVNEATDTETMFAIMEAIPVVLRIGGADERTVAVNLAHAERRLHELSGDVTAYDAAREAEELMAELQGTFAAARGEFGDPRGQRGTLENAIGNHYARQVVRARNQEALNMRTGEGWQSRP